MHKDVSLPAPAARSELNTGMGERISKVNRLYPWW